MRNVQVVLALGLGLAGCAHEAAGPSMGGIGAQADATLEGAFDAVKSGARATARGAGYVVEKVSDSTVRVMREAGLNRAAGGVSDAWIKAKVTSTFAVDGDVKGRDIQVDSDAGVVTLRGTVESQAKAVKAIADALDTNGVVAVNSELDFPTSQANIRTYEK